MTAYNFVSHPHNQTLEPPCVAQNTTQRHRKVLRNKFHLNGNFNDLILRLKRWNLIERHNKQFHMNSGDIKLALKQ